jgi:hypothetical protein
MDASLLSLRSGFRLCDFLPRNVHFVERLPGAADRPDEVRVAGGTNCFPQPTDMHIDSTIIDVVIATPDAIDPLRQSESSRSCRRRAL